MLENNNIIPNLFIVGFQKCGSTSLFNLLLDHPEIVGSSPKETYMLVDNSYPFYNCKYNIRNGTDWDKYFHNQSLKLQDYTYYMEASVCNYYQQTAKDYISEVPEAKVIFIIRDPIKRFISTFNYNTSYLMKTFGRISINEYYNLVVNRKIDHEMCKRAITGGKYCSIIEEWTELLGSNNVLVTSLEQLQLNTIKTIEEIFKYLNLNYDDKIIKLNHRNPSMSIKNKFIHNLLLRYGSNVSNSWLKKTLRSAYTRLNFSTNKEYVELDVTLTNKLFNYYILEYEAYGDFFKK